MRDRFRFGNEVNEIDGERLSIRLDLAFDVQLWMKGIDRCGSLEPMVLASQHSLSRILFYIIPLISILN